MNNSEHEFESLDTRSKLPSWVPVGEVVPSHAVVDTPYRRPCTCGRSEQAELEELRARVKELEAEVAQLKHPPLGEVPFMCSCCGKTVARGECPACGSCEKCCNCGYDPSVP